MKSFLIKSSVFLFLFFGSILFILISNDYLVNQQLVKINQDKKIVIIGDSNAECAVDDSIYKESLNLSASADSYFFSYLKLKKFLENKNKIDIVMLSFAPHNIYDNSWISNTLYSKFRSYYYIMDKEDIFFLMEGYLKKTILAISPIGKELIKNIIKKLKNDNSYEFIGGYLKLDRDILDEVIIKLNNNESIPFFELPENKTISKDEILYLKKIQDLCEKYNKKLILVNFPKRKELLESDRYPVEEFNLYYKKNLSKITFIDISEFKMPRNYYGDLVHLNKLGSHYFSEFLENNSLGEIIKEYSVK